MRDTPLRGVSFLFGEYVLVIAINIIFVEID